MSRSAGSVLADYVFKFMKHRTKRDIGNEFIKINRVDNENPPKLPESHKHAFSGGERAILYAGMKIKFSGKTIFVTKSLTFDAVLEDFLSQFGLDGHGCVLRTICEIHSKNVHRYGLIGEFMKLFFTYVTLKKITNIRIVNELKILYSASLSPFSELDVFSEYVKAEKMGKEISECYPFFQRCPKSIFRSSASMSYAQKSSVTMSM